MNATHLGLLGTVFFATCAAALIGAAGADHPAPASMPVTTPATSPATLPTTAPAGGKLFRVTLDKPADRVRVGVEGGSVVLEVTSETGIGGMRLDADKAGWPDHIVLRLKGFQTLEGFSAANAHVSCNSSLRAEAPEVHRLGPDGQAAGEVPADAPGRPRPDYRMPIERKGANAGQGGSVEVAIPAALYPSEEKFLKLRWIDAYR